MPSACATRTQMCSSRQARAGDLWGVTGEWENCKVAIALGMEEINPSFGGVGLC